MQPLPPHLEFEGPWEEIVRQGNRLSGRLVRVTTVDDVDQNELREQLSQWLEHIKTIKPDANSPAVGGPKQEVSDLVGEKFRKQGFNV